MISKTEFRKQFVFVVVTAMTDNQKKKQTFRNQ